MRRLAIVLLAALLAAPRPVVAAEAAPPHRIVSMNACTDQLLMLLADPGRIASVSYLAADPDVSAMTEEAAAFPLNYGLLEEVLTFQPDLVVAGTLTTRPTVFGLRRFGIPVVEVPPARTFDDIRTNLRTLGAAIGAGTRAEELVAAFDARLAALGPTESERDESDWPLAAIYGANGWSAGPGTLRHAVLQAAGLRNLATEARIGARSHLPLEVLVAARPEVLVTSARSPQSPSLAEAILAHPAFAALRDRAAFAAVPQALWACGTPLIVEAVAILARAAGPIP